MSHSLHTKQWYLHDGRLNIYSSSSENYVQHLTFSVLEGAYLGIPTTLLVGFEIIDSLQ